MDQLSSAGFQCHLLSCPPALLPGPGKQTCHYEKIRPAICLCVCAEPIISANPPQLFVALRALLFLISLSGTAALATQSNLGQKWKVNKKVLLINVCIVSCFCVLADIACAFITCVLFVVSLY